MIELIKNRNLIFSIGFIATILVLVVPIPPFILDICLSFNIAMALAILLVTIFIREKSEFSTFPAILLLVTLIRFILNLCSMRAILCRHGAQIEIIKALGQSVIGNNYILGIIIFSLLMVIQYLVITGNADRVAEVAERFTLDDMPKKQIAISVDLNTDIITNDEAMQLQKQLHKEADFLESMEGATKFVKGETMAGIFIVYINIVGGMISGIVLHGDHLIDATETYTLLTVGAGLVSQLPAM
ncbi:MAG: FHIPEP family type III secretion protein, partial [Candidatus Riflebacteria bacterium]|nr:FHIPEP family type III secretion protein [Candidatus Riflebacteria bacterium]